MAAPGTTVEHTLTDLQFELAIEDRRARRFITQFDKTFCFEVVRAGTGHNDTIYFIDVAKSVWGNDAVVKALDELYAVWKASGHRKPDGWNDTVADVFGKWGNIFSLATVLNTDTNNVKNHPHDLVLKTPFPNN